MTSHLSHTLSSAAWPERAGLGPPGAGGGPGGCFLEVSTRHSWKNSTNGRIDDELKDEKQRLRSERVLNRAANTLWGLFFFYDYYYFLWRNPAYFCPIRGIISSSVVSDTSWSPERSIAVADCFLLLQSLKLLFSSSPLSIITTAFIRDIYIALIYIYYHRLVKINNTYMNKIFKKTKQKTHNRDSYTQNSQTATSFIECRCILH